MNPKNLFLSILTVLGLSLALIAQPGMGSGPGRGERGGGPGPGLDRMLDLSEEQEAKIQDLRLQHQKEMLPLRSQLESLGNDLKLAMTADKFDKAKAEKIINEMEKIRTRLHLARVLHQQAVRELLTPEQRKKFDMHLLSGKAFRGPNAPRPDRPGRFFDPDFPHWRQRGGWEAPED